MSGYLSTTNSYFCTTEALKKYFYPARVQASVLWLHFWEFSLWFFGWCHILLMSGGNICINLLLLLELFIVVNSQNLFMENIDWGKNCFKNPKQTKREGGMFSLEKPFKCGIIIRANKLIWMKVSFHCSKAWCREGRKGLSACGRHY